MAAYSVQVKGFDERFEYSCFLDVMQRTVARRLRAQGLVTISLVSYHFLLIYYLSSFDITTTVKDYPKQNGMLILLFLRDA